jgi:hypothetical protein
VKPLKQKIASFALAGLAALALFTIAGLVGCTAIPAASPTPAPTPTAVPPTPLTPGTLTGLVVDQDGAPVSKAQVSIQATTLTTLTDNQGRFSLSGLEDDQPVTVSAWKDKYYCAAQAPVTPPAAGLHLVLRLVQTGDNSDYTWVPPTGENSCYSCKPGVTQVWLDNDAHGQSAVNPRFLSMYNGTDLQGNRSPLTRYAETRDYGRVPVPPDPGKPYFGPGYKLDFPIAAGNCAACHIPGAAIDNPYGVDPNQVSGVDKSGIHCDFCHKIGGVLLDPQSSLPYSEMPGVLSLDMRRPFPEDKQRYQLFFGTFADDNVPMEDTRLPLISQSQFCAACHYGIFWNTLVYNSYGEWLQSPYSDPKTGQTCQGCHTPSPTLLDGQPLTNVAPGKGGVERDPLTIHAHTFPGASSQALLQNALTMRVDAKRKAGQLSVTVKLTNDKTGHAVPSDSPLRHLILLVEPTNSKGKRLVLLQGEKVPSWGGVGDPAQGYYAGLPGKAYAKVLAELWTEISPTGAYWNPTRLVSDNRLLPYASDSSTYVFGLPAQSAATVHVRLIYRRAYRALSDQKGWAVPDILMAEDTIQIK